jgi:hypothetical protein
MGDWHDDDEWWRATQAHIFGPEVSERAPREVEQVVALARLAALLRVLGEARLAIEDRADRRGHRLVLVHVHAHGVAGLPGGRRAARGVHAVAAGLQLNSRGALRRATIM